MKTLILATILLASTLCSAAFAQHIPVFCDAPWPPPSGSNNTIGKDNEKLPCVKIGSDSGFKVIFAKEGDTYHQMIDADMVVIGQTYLTFKKSGAEVARVEKQYVILWVKIEADKSQTD